MAVSRPLEIVEVGAARAVARPARDSPLGPCDTCRPLRRATCCPRLPEPRLWSGSPDLGSSRFAARRRRLRLFPDSPPARSRWRGGRPLEVALGCPPRGGVLLDEPAAPRRCSRIAKLLGRFACRRAPRSTQPYADPRSTADRPTGLLRVRPRSCRGSRPEGPARSRSAATATRARPGTGPGSRRGTARPSGKHEHVPAVAQQFGDDPSPRRHAPSVVRSRRNRGAPPARGRVRRQHHARRRRQRWGRARRTRAGSAGRGEVGDDQRRSVRSASSSAPCMSRVSRLRSMISSGGGGASRQPREPRRRLTRRPPGSAGARAGSRCGVSARRWRRRSPGHRPGSRRRGSRADRRPRDRRRPRPRRRSAAAAAAISYHSCNGCTPWKAWLVRYRWAYQGSPGELGLDVGADLVRVARCGTARRRRSRRRTGWCSGEKSLGIGW